MSVSLTSISDFEMAYEDQERRRVNVKVEVVSSKRETVAKSTWMVDDYRGRSRTVMVAWRSTGVTFFDQVQVGNNGFIYLYILD
jgi:hypothetical protein